MTGVYSVQLSRFGKDLSAIPENCPHCEEGKIGLGIPCSMCNGSGHTGRLAVWLEEPNEKPQLIGYTYAHSVQIYEAV